MNGAPKISKNDQDILNMIINPGLPFGNSDESSDIDDTDNQFDPIKLAEVKRLEKQGIQRCEDRDYAGALECFDQAVEMLPARASGFNNRAQVKRLQENIEGAMQDLNSAIQLSSGIGKVASMAFSQRGMIHKLQGKQEEAFSDFQKAAELGNPFAKKEVVALNPYAALCNQMLSKAFKDLQTGENN